MIKVVLGDGNGKGATACITPRGELVFNKAGYSVPYTASATVIDTGYNFTDLSGDGIEPKSGKRFIITEILVSSDRNVGATSGALINIYEADSPSSITITKNIIEDLEIVKNQRQFLTLNMIVTEGKWVNIKTDDNNVRATVWGFYVDA